MKVPAQVRAQGAIPALELFVRNICVSLSLPAITSPSQCLVSGGPAFSALSWISGAAKGASGRSVSETNHTSS